MSTRKGKTLTTWQVTLLALIIATLPTDLFAENISVDITPAVPADGYPTIITDSPITVVRKRSSRQTKGNKKNKTYKTKKTLVSTPQNAGAKQNDDIIAPIIPTDEENANQQTDPKLFELDTEPLKPGDELWVVIPGPISIDKKVRIDEDGTVDLGFYGALKLSEKTVPEAQIFLREQLKHYLRHTGGVYLNLHRRGRMVFVTGKVEKPGLVTIRTNTDILRALQLAGGVASGADLTRVTLIRSGVEIEFDLRAYMTRENYEPLPNLQPGDTIFVPADPALPPAKDGRLVFLSQNALKRKIFVLGAVNQPGLYDRDDSFDPMIALGLANGPTDRADLAHARLLTQNDSRHLNLIKTLNGQKSKPIDLPNEGAVILYIPAKDRDLLDGIRGAISVMGGVSRPGTFHVPGPIHLIEAVGLAGGPTTDADITNVYVVKAGKGFTLATKYDLQRYMEEGGMAGRVLIEPGDSVLVDDDTLKIWDGLVKLISDVAIIAMATTVFISAGL